MGKDIRELRGDYLIALINKYGWKKGVELGVWYGQTFFRVLDACPGVSLIGVDIWIPGHVDNAGHHMNQKQNREDVLSRVPAYGARAKILEMTTTEAAAKIRNGSLDFVFIDADHTVESFREDVAKWLPKLKPAGWITGHDFLFPGINQGVKELLMPVNCPIKETDETFARPLRIPREATTICCLKQGKKYPSKYVNTLANMVMRNVHLEPYDFVCFTDDAAGIDPWIRTAPLPFEAPGWWGKMGLYRKEIPGVHTKRILFLDLDVVLTGSLDPVLQLDSDFALIRDYPADSREAKGGNGNDGNTSAVLLRVGSRAEIWAAYEKAGKPTVDDCGDQGWLNQHFPRSFDLIPEALAQSYRLHNLDKRSPSGCSIVMFHGEPKPHECGGWVAEYWK